MIPIVFWASLLPWLNAMYAAEPTCRRRNVLFRRPGCARTKGLKISAMNSRPTVKPMIGEANRGIRTFVVHRSATKSIPAAIRDARAGRR